MDLKNGTQMDSDPETVFLLIDLYKSVIHIQLLFRAVKNFFYVQY